MNQKHRMYGVLDDRETEVLIEVSVYSWGRPETPPAYAHGGLPAEGPELEVTDAWLLEDAEPRPSIWPSLTDAETARYLTEFLERDHD